MENFWCKTRFKMKRRIEDGRILQKEVVRDWLKKTGVEAFVFDLDDTLISTREIFHRQMDILYNNFQVILPDLSREEIKRQFEGMNDRAYEKYKVNPQRWDAVLDEFCQHHSRIQPLDKRASLKILGEIYTTIPEFKPGVEETLSVLKSADAKIGVVTHANEKWTKWKKDVLSLGRFIKEENIYVVSEDGDKDKIAWQAALDNFGLNASAVAVVGDSVRTDIFPAYEIGVRYLFWVKNEIEWAVHKKEAPQGVVQIAGVDELINVLKK